ncbi:protein AkeP [Aspergillus heterothallicus]
MSFKTYHPSFNPLVAEGSITLCMQNDAYPFAHEAGVYIPATDSLFITSSRFRTINGAQKIQISKITRQGNKYTQEEITPSPDVIPMGNGGVNYKDGVLFCSQGTLETPSALVYMEASAPYNSTVILDGFHGRRFNSVNDVVVHSDGSIWFTDPAYGHEQGFRPRPELPAQVYRFDPATGAIRVVADGLGKPNGISFSPDEKIVYVTDTDMLHGKGDGVDVDLTRAATIYAFDVKYYSGEPFLVNRRVFAMADTGIPDGIKCDLQGNVYSGCGDGINVWSPGGILLGKILIPGGVANFCFALPREILALNEHRLWRVTLGRGTRGALLKL